MKANNQKVSLRDVHVWLSPPQYEELKRAAETDERSVANMARVLLNEALSAREAKMQRVGESPAP